MDFEIERASGGRSILQAIFAASYVAFDLLIGDTWAARETKLSIGPVIDGGGDKGARRVKGWLHDT